MDNTQWRVTMIKPEELRELLKKYLKFEFELCEDGFYKVNCYFINYTKWWECFFISLYRREKIDYNDLISIISRITNMQISIIKHKSHYVSVNFVRSGFLKPDCNKIIRYTVRRHFGQNGADLESLGFTYINRFCDFNYNESRWDKYVSISEFIDDIINAYSDLIDECSSQVENIEEHERVGNKIIECKWQN